MVFYAIRPAALAGAGWLRRERPMFSLMKNFDRKGR
jgi:hypothetical protein